VAHVEVSLVAIERLDRMIATHSLPADTWARVSRSLRRLEQFPSIGRRLDERWEGLRFILGPWRWLLIVYAYEQTANRVLVVTIQDARSSSAVTSLSLRR
jgi:plasmid stabilization system protein ParE